MSTLKEKYQRFRHWQENPFNYHDSHDHHECCNCGGESENNYCPRCGQRAVYGPITWQSVWQGILDVWGVGTRSLPYSLWQLIWRPGYLIRDYISGKRQESFPPVKMLVIVALVLALFKNIFEEPYVESPDDGSGAGSKAFQALGFNIIDWLTNHIAWEALVAFSFFIIPVWFLFRQAPRLPRHTLPQGFYIQVFVGAQYLLYLLLLVLLFELVPFLSGGGEDAMNFMVFVGLPVMLLVDYRQLFGYSWWGTLWRALVALPLMLLFAKILQYSLGCVYCICVADWHNALMYLMDAVGLLAMAWIILEIVHLINNRSKLGGFNAKTVGRIVCAIVALLLAYIVSHSMGLKTPFDIILRVLDALFA